MCLKRSERCLIILILIILIPYGVFLYTRHCSVLTHLIITVTLTSYALLCSQFTNEKTKAQSSYLVVLNPGANFGTGKRFRHFAKVLILNIEHFYRKGFFSFYFHCLLTYIPSK